MIPDNQTAMWRTILPFLPCAVAWGRSNRISLMLDIAQTFLERDGGKSNGLVADAVEAMLNTRLDSPHSLLQPLYFGQGSFETLERLEVKRTRDNPHCISRLFPTSLYGGSFGTCKYIVDSVSR